MEIRKANLDDLNQIHQLGKNTPELKVSNSTEFSTLKELETAISSKSGVFLIAVINSQIVGFIYANTNDFETPLTDTACIVYIVVSPIHRNHKIGQALYTECEIRLKKLGIKTLYCWASLEGKGEITNFMHKNGFNSGHKYIWMDKEL